MSTFSKSRLEALSDGVFAIAMTLLVLELKVPALPKGSAPAEIWAALGHDALGFLGFAMSFLLAGYFWILQHEVFRQLKDADRRLAPLTLFYLLFVSLLPFSTSMLTHFGLRDQVALIWYLGNFWVLSALLALKWRVARASASLHEVSIDRVQRVSERMMYAMPFVLLIPIAAVFVAPAAAIRFLWISMIVTGFIARRRVARAA